MRSGLLTLDHIRTWCVLRHEDEALQSCARSVCGRRHRKFCSSELLRHRNRDCHTAGFKTLSGIGRLIFYVKLVQSQLFSNPLGVEDRGPAFAQRDDVFVTRYWQHLLVTPKVGLAVNQGFLCQIPLSLLKIVPHQKRLTTLAAKVLQPLCLML